MQLDCDIVLVSVGRRPFTENLGVTELGIDLDNVRISLSF